MAAAADLPRPADASRRWPLGRSASRERAPLTAAREAAWDLPRVPARMRRGPAAAAAASAARPLSVRLGRLDRAQASDSRARRPATEHAQRARPVCAVRECREARVRVCPPPWQGVRGRGRGGWGRSGQSGGGGYKGDPGAPARPRTLGCAEACTTLGAQGLAQRRGFLGSVPEH